MSERRLSSSRSATRYRPSGRHGRITGTASSYCCTPHPAARLGSVGISRGFPCQHVHLCPPSSGFVYSHARLCAVNVWIVTLLRSAPRRHVRKLYVHLEWLSHTYVHLEWLCSCVCLVRVFFASTVCPAAHRRVGLDISDCVHLQRPGVTASCVRRPHALCRITGTRRPRPKVLTPRH